MKLMAALLVALLLFSSSAHSQTALQKYAASETLTGEQFADVVKAVWDELKKASDEYAAEMASKNEFETTQEFQARIRTQRDAYWGKIVKFNDANRFGEHQYAVLVKVDLRSYNADKQAYAIRASSSIIVPPSGDRVKVNCTPNPYVLIRESKKRGYKYAHIVLNTDPDFIWHVNSELAGAAKGNEAMMYFKVWFRFDITQPLVNTTARLSIIPTKIALINTGDNTVYWTDNITR